MQNQRLEEESIIKDVRSLFRFKKLKKETIDTTIKDIRIFFGLEKENEEIKDIILRNIRNIFENEEEEHYYKLVRVSNFCSNNYIEYKNNGDRKLHHI